LVSHTALEEAEVLCRRPEKTDEVARIGPQDDRVSSDLVPTMPGKV
jgi:hypothetical protein